MNFIVGNMLASTPRGLLKHFGVVSCQSQFYNYGLPLYTVQKSIISTLMLHSFFNSLARSRYQPNKISRHLIRQERSTGSYFIFSRFVSELLCLFLFFFFLFCFGFVYFLFVCFVLFYLFLFFVFFVLFCLVYVFFFFYKSHSVNKRNIF